MQFVSLDLEMNQPSGKIIQIGACVGELDTGEIIDNYNVLVQIDEPLTPFIIQLTGITQLALDTHGIPLLRAYDGLVSFCERYPDRFLNVVTWGGGDSIELQRQVEEQVIPDKPSKNVFGRRWIDVKTLYQAHCFRAGTKPQAGLSKAMIRVGMNFRGRKHDALDDAINTFRIFHKLVKLV